MRRVMTICLLVSALAVFQATACTFFSFASEKLVLFGNSEDYADPETRLWTVPADENSYACVFLGFSNLFAQGGVNEAGLAFDAASISATPLNDHPELPIPDPINFCEIVLRTCATIDDVVETLGQYNLSYVTSAQFLFTDRSGATLVVAPGLSRELEYSRSQTGYEAVANTNEVTYPQSLPYDRRHRMATEALERIAAGEVELSIDSFRAILAQVAQTSGSSETSYSNIFDLTNGILYLYAWHDFENPRIFDLAEWFDDPQSSVYEIDALFAESASS